MTKHDYRKDKSEYPIIIIIIIIKQQQQRQKQRKIYENLRSFTLRGYSDLPWAPYQGTLYYFSCLDKGA